jgi:outer membrane protein assembly factor BamA
VVVGTDVSAGYAAPAFQTVSERLVTLEAALVGDTTRYQSFGPFQGKRFRLGAYYGINVGGDVSGNLEMYEVDFRAYKQLTRRSLLAWRLGGVFNAGDRETYFAFGGINQLRGYPYRDFFGSRVAWSNLELRFPLVDLLQFPFLGIRSIRGFLFADVGSAWFQDGSFYDPELFYGSIRYSPKFKFWDSDNDRFQDARGSYGAGMQFIFLGGLQFNWAWSHRMDYTRFVPQNPNDFLSPLVPVAGDSAGNRLDFYIIYDF